MAEKKGSNNQSNKKDDKCFQYAVTTALTYHNIKYN